MEVTSIINEKTDGMLMFSILLGVFLIMLLGLKLRWDTARSLGASSFVCTILSVFFMIMGFVQVYVVIMYVAFTIISLIVLYTENG